MKSVILFLGVLILNSAQAQENFHAQVLVKNFNDQLIPNAEVQLLDTNGTIINKGITDGNGQFMIRMSPGKYQIRLLIANEIRKQKMINLPVLSENKIYNQVRIFVLFEERNHFILENLLFENNSAVLNENSFQILDKLIDYLNDDATGIFEISGHTDNVGSSIDNFLLSQQRADVVVDYLISKGIKAERLTAKGYGESLPIADNNLPEGRAMNRRTEIKKLN